MRSIIVATLLVCLAAPSASPLGAQTAPPQDSALVAPAEPRPDSVPVIVRVSSRKLPFMVGDLAMMNCSFNGSDGFASVLPYGCVRHTTGTLTKLDPDSITFVRNGRIIRLAARDVKKLEQLAGRSTVRTVAHGVLGAASGVVGAAMIGIGGGLRTDGQFAVAATLLGTVGAVIGAQRGGLQWTEVPRSFDVGGSARR